MREIKFRIWDNHTKRYETCVYESHKDCYLFIGRSGYVTAFNCYGEEIDFEDNRFIIQQHIGQQDTNGKDIYEGDILQEFRNNETEKALGVCEEVLGGWRILSIDGAYWHGWKQVIIGNIFENPELLQKLS